MNTTTTMNQHRTGLAPNKRKDREFQKPSKFIKPSVYRAAALTEKQPSPTPTPISDKPAASKSQVLAGYMAYEFLNKGTLFGKPWEQIEGGAKPVSDEPRQVEKYMEVASLLKTDGGLQIDGVVNPTQLTRFIKLYD